MLREQQGEFGNPTLYGLTKYSDELTMPVALYLVIGIRE